MAEVAVASMKTVQSRVLQRPSASGAGVNRGKDERDVNGEMAARVMMQHDACPIVMMPHGALLCGWLEAS